MCLCVFTFQQFPSKHSFLHFLSFHDHQFAQPFTQTLVNISVIILFNAVLKQEPVFPFPALLTCAMLYCPRFLVLYFTFNYNSIMVMLYLYVLQKQQKVRHISCISPCVSVYPFMLFLLQRGELKQCMQCNLAWHLHSSSLFINPAFACSNSLNCCIFEGGFACLLNFLFYLLHGNCHSRYMQATYRGWLLVCICCCLLSQKWLKIRNNFNEISHYTDIWRGTLKEIEGRYKVFIYHMGS